MNTNDADEMVVFPALELLIRPVTATPSGPIQEISGVTDRAACFVTVQVIVYIRPATATPSLVVDTLTVDAGTAD